jgi:hypothetical protein
MESVLALQKSLGRQTLCIKDVTVRSLSLTASIKTMNNALTIAISNIALILADLAKKKAAYEEAAKEKTTKKGFFYNFRLKGGAMIYSSYVLENYSGIGNISHALEEVQLAMPYIDANVKQLIKNCEEASMIAENARKIDAKLTPIVQRSMPNADGVPSLDLDSKATLYAFNSTMAQLDSSISVLTSVANDLMLDMNNAIDIFDKLYKLSLKAQEIGLDLRVSSSISMVFQEGASMADTVKQISELLLTRGVPSKLLHSSVFSYDNSFLASESALSKLKKNFKQ